ncbi:MAG: response regulator [Anaerolineae bacterium]|nr:response regulator [Gloeobacterales cyanobacterium ES-bin-313]
MRQAWITEIFVFEVVRTGMDGYQLCKMFPALQEVPVVMLTSKDTLFDRILANLVGASDYLIKPTAKVIDAAMGEEINA